MNDKKLDAIAVRVLEIWLISMDLKIVGDWDENDRSCRRDYGPHRVFTVCGNTTEDIDTEKLEISLERYLFFINKALPGVNFQVYDLQAYDNLCGCGTNLYPSICV